MTSQPLDQRHAAQPTPDRLDLPDHAAAPVSKTLRTAYDAEAVATILSDISTGSSLRRACNTHGIAPSSLLRWVREDQPAGLSEQYARAREQQAHALADGIVDLAMDEATKADPNLLRVRLDAAKWAASKILPRVYGDRIDINANVNATVTPGWVVDLTQVVDVTAIPDGTAVQAIAGPNSVSDPPDID